MNKLMIADMRRMIKHPALWICTGLQILLTFALSVHYRTDGGLYGLDHAFMTGYSFYGIAVSEVMTFIVAILVIGKDYQNNTVRNKIIMGYSRGKIYCSYFFTILVSAFIMFAIRLAFFCIFSLPLIKTFQYTREYLLAIFFMSVFSLVLYSAFALFALVITQSSTKAMVICLSLFIISMGLFLTGLIVVNCNESEYASNVIVSQHDYVFDDDWGKGRSAYSDFNKFLFDFLPSGRTMQVWNGSPLCVWKLFLYLSLQIIGFVTGGAIIFRYQNIR